VTGAASAEVRGLEVACATVARAGYSRCVSRRQRHREYLARFADEHGSADGAFNVGVYLRRRGDVEGAEAAWRRADERGSARGTFRLGVLLFERGDFDGARAAWIRAEERGLVASGAFNLGLAYSQLGEQDAAYDAFCRADAAGNPKAAFRVGRTLMDRRDFAGAEQALLRALQRGFPLDCVLQVLGSCAQAQGDFAGAERYHRRAAAEGIAVGAVGLGLLLEARGDLPGAEQAYAQADELGEGMGSTNLGAIRAAFGDIQGAQEAWRRGADRSDPLAASNLAALYELRGDSPAAEGARDEAERAYRAINVLTEEELELLQSVTRSGELAYGRWIVGRGDIGNSPGWAVDWQAADDETLSE
jgi:tetratricopeptide (TPR) repeat protein